MAKKPTFVRKARGKGKPRRGGSTSFDFGANARGGKKRRGGFGGGS
jgi:hypothetical protein